MRNGDLQIISPQVVERLGVASDMSLVPHIFRDASARVCRYQVESAKILGPGRAKDAIRNNAKKATDLIVSSPGGSKILTDCARYPQQVRIASKTTPERYILTAISSAIAKLGKAVLVWLAQMLVHRRQS